jgi:hypothetical protein
MAVEATKSGDRQIVGISWDTGIVTGEVVQLYCVNPANGDVSVSGISRNDGEGYVTYPLNYVGSTEVTVYDNDGNADFGLVTVGEDGEVDTDPDAHPEHPIVLPPETDLKPEHPIALPDPHPEHPIVLPPLGIWGGVPPEYVDIGGPGDQPKPEHPIVVPPDPEDGPPLFPSHPIVIPDDDFWTGNLPPFAQPVGE